MISFVSVLALSVVVCVIGITLTERTIRQQEQKKSVIQINRKRVRTGKIWGQR